MVDAHQGSHRVVVGLPPRGTTIAGADPITLVLKSLRILGTRVGSFQETHEALMIAAAGKVKPAVTVFPFEQFLEAVDLVVRIPSSSLEEFDS